MLTQNEVVVTASANQVDYNKAIAVSLKKSSRFEVNILKEPRLSLQPFNFDVVKRFSIFDVNDQKTNGVGASRCKQNQC